MKWANSRIQWTLAASCTITPTARAPLSQKNWWSPSMRPCSYLVKLSVGPNRDQNITVWSSPLLWGEKHGGASVWSASVMLKAGVLKSHGGILILGWGKRKNLGDFRRNGITLKYIKCSVLSAVRHFIFSNRIEKEKRHFCIIHISLVTQYFGLFFLFCGDMHCESRIVFCCYPFPTLPTTCYGLIFPIFADIYSWVLMVFANIHILFNFIFSAIDAAWKQKCLEIFSLQVAWNFK